VKINSRTAPRVKSASGFALRRMATSLPQSAGIHAKVAWRRRLGDHVDPWAGFRVQDVVYLLRTKSGILR
jgi:hypothetical protein